MVGVTACQMLIYDVGQSDSHNVVQLQLYLPHIQPELLYLTISTYFCQFRCYNLTLLHLKLVPPCHLADLDCVQGAGSPCEPPPPSTDSQSTLTSSEFKCHTTNCRLLVPPGLGSEKNATPHQHDASTTTLDRHHPTAAILYRRRGSRPNRATNLPDKHRPTAC